MTALPRIDDKRNGLLKEDGSLLIQEIPGFLSEQECNAFMQFANKKGYQKPNFGNARVCERLHTVNETLSTWVMDKLKESLPSVVEVDGVRWGISRFTHHWRYVHYTPGGHFAPHYDGSKMLPWKEMSVFTVQIYLNQGFTGGNTRFYMDFAPNRMTPKQVEYGEVAKFNPENPPTHAVNPQTGSALVFNHTENTLHDGEPVTEGEKFILRGDVLYSALEEDRPLLENSTIPPHLRMWSNEAAKRGDTKTYVGEIWHCQCGDDLCGVKQMSPQSEKRVKALSAPRVILLSGKRAAGKDFVADKIQKLFEKFNFNVHRTALGELNKKLYAEKNNLDITQFEDRAFKEEHRIAMVKHHTEMDEMNPEWAVKTVLKEAKNKEADILIVSDVRRLKDLQWYQNNSTTPPLVLRIDASFETRVKRGLDPNPIKDQLPTEVELDEYEAWTARFDNSDTSDASAKKVEEWVNSAVVLPVVLDLSRANS